MQVKFDDNFVYLKTPWEHRDFVRETLNGVWSKSKGMYRFPKNLWSMRELASYYPELGQNQMFVNTGKRLAEIRQKFLELKAMNDADGDERLRPYQRADVHYLSKLPSAGIFNQPRTGKTPTSIELMKQLGAKRNLVIAPASLIWNWAAEFEQWAPEMQVLVISGNFAKRVQSYGLYRERTADRVPSVLVISKDTWKSDLDYFDGYEFDTCFVDEAHYLRNYKTAQSEAVFKIKAKHRYALTGTPSVKHGKDIYGILHYLFPTKFNSYWQMIERYWGTYQDSYGTNVNDEVKPERKTELEELIGFISVQRLRKDVMRWLPDKEYIMHRVKMDTKQRKLYDQMVDTFVAMDEESDAVVDTENVLAQLMRMRQICLDPALIGFNAPSAKTAAILEYMENNQEPIVIMSMFTSYLKRLKPEIEKLGLKVGEINGEMSNSEKMESADKFQSGGYEVLLCNAISAGTGFTLDKAETILFTDKPWNPSEVEQCEDRITPVTEDRNHKHAVISMVCTDSVDYKIERLLEDKISLTDIVNNGGREAIKALLFGS